MSLVFILVAVGLAILGGIGVGIAIYKIGMAAPRLLLAIWGVDVLVIAAVFRAVS